MATAVGCRGRTPTAGQEPAWQTDRDVAPSLGTAVSRSTREVPLAASPFQLVRFPGAGPHRDLVVTGTIERADRDLVVRWSIRGDLSGVVVAGPASVPARRDALWTETCFEIFAARPGDSGYRELNLAPSGDWNVYRFTGYRREMRPEGTARAPGCAVALAPRALDVTLRCPLAGLDAAATPLEVAVAAVLRAPAGALSHWALSHPSRQPDFHWRPGFRLRV